MLKHDKFSEIHRKIMVKMNGMYSRESYIQEEAEWIEESGEIPEVSFHEAVTYLAEQEDGPKLTLAPSDIKLLEDAVIYRYKNIILRDLDYTNRGSTVFRGMKRAITLISLSQFAQRQ